MYTKRKKIFLSLFAILFGVLGLSCEAEMRFWHDRSGNEFRGEFSKEVFGNIYFRGTDGKVFPVAATNLIESDLDYIHGLIPPQIKIKFTKKIREIKEFPPEYNPAAWDDHEMEITGRVEIKKTSREPYYGTLRGELYLIGEEVATDDFRLFAKKGFAISFPDNKLNVYQNQLTSSLRYFSRAGLEPRGAKYKGYVVLVFTDSGDLHAFDSDISWMKEEKVDALRKITVPGFMDENCKKQSIPRPTDYRDPGPVSY